MNRIDIDTYEIEPPLPGGLAWGAKAMVYGPDGHYDKPLHTTGECWGRTRFEAAMKARAVAHQWTSA